MKMRMMYVLVVLLGLKFVTPRIVRRDAPTTMRSSVIDNKALGKDGNPISHENTTHARFSNSTEVSILPENDDSTTDNSTATTISTDMNTFPCIDANMTAGNVTQLPGCVTTQGPTDTTAEVAEDQGGWPVIGIVGIVLLGIVGVCLTGVGIAAFITFRRFTAQSMANEAIAMNPIAPCQY